jgi:ATP-dependent DNA helicase RecG
MLSDDELRYLLQHGEADHVERTISVNDSDKFGEAICAFANDLPDRRGTSVLFIGVQDDGQCAGIPIEERLIQTLLGFRTNGNILPPPMIRVRRHVLDGCTMAVVEVLPSDNPPLKYRGRVCIRVGPRRGFATAEEERRLVEKRVWGNLPFDQQPVAGASIGDLDTLRFQEEYLPVSVHPDVVAANRRSVEEQMRSLSLLGPRNEPTVVGLLVCGKDAREWLPGAYVQFARYPGDEVGDAVQDQKEISGPISDLFRRMDEIVEANITQSSELSGPTEIIRSSYPTVAIQELVRNAVIHRNYQGTSAPVMITWYSNRIEITSPGGPYGSISAETFGQPGLTDARNPALASAAKALGFVQRFGSGIPRARAALRENSNPEPEFRIEPNFVHVTIRLKQ